MGKKSLSSSSQSWWWRGWRYLHPQHNLRSPQLLTLFIISFVALTWLLSGLESLSVEHQVFSFSFLDHLCNYACTMLMLYIQLFVSIFQNNWSNFRKLENL